MKENTKVFLTYYNDFSILTIFLDITFFRLEFVQI